MAAPLAILNPTSGHGATRRRWSRLERVLREVLGPVEVEHTRGARDAGRIAREAVRGGCSRLLVAGGDGTLSEVADGLLSADLGEEVELGLLPLGSGSDLARTLGLPRDPEAAARALASGATRRIDAGRIDYRARDGGRARTHFVNVASFGISGLVDELVNRAGKRFGGTLSFLVGALQAIAQYRAADVVVRVDGKEIHDGPLVLAAAGNGRFFGGGMQIAPGAELDDGLLDVVLTGDASKRRLLALLPPLYRGQILDHPSVVHGRARVVEADADDRDVWLDVDGEPLGMLPARIEVLPAALTFFGLPS